MTSVILPTRTWGSVAADLAAQVGDDDELLVVCDHESDPVADRETPDGVQVIVAGDPEGCSGKCNAVAAGMEAADCERIVWTDDDFPHPEDWLETLVAEGERRGPVTEVPVFVGEGPWWLPVEPTYVVLGSAVVAYGGAVWAGGVTFTRDELPAGVDGLVADLRRSVSDDGTLGDHLESVTPLRDRTRTVEVDGTPREVYHRIVRFVSISYYQDRAGTLASTALLGLLAVLGLLWPFLVAPAVTAGVVGYYRRFDVDRPSWVLAFPSLLLVPVQFAVGILADEFEWGGRRYRWTGKYDVELVDR